MEENISQKEKEKAEEEMIEQAFQELLNDYLATKHRKRVEIITKAFNFANQAHKGIKRRSGEPYIMHPIAVAKIVCNEIGLGSTSICSALLHDVVEDTDYTVEDIENIFGPKIAQIVDGLTKISGGIFGDHCSPISDTTVMSSMGSSCDHIDHVRTQLPYALTVAGSSLVGYIVSGLMKGGAFVGLAITLVLICLVSFLLNKHVGRGKDAKAPQDAA